MLFRSKENGTSHAERLELKEEVRKVLGEVKEKYRIVLIMKDMEGMSSEEIAEILQRKPATIRWRLAEGRKMFRELWLARDEGMVA